MNKTKIMPIETLIPSKLKVKELRYTNRSEQKYYDIPPTPMIIMEDGTHLFLLSTRQGILGFKRGEKDAGNSAVGD